MKKIFLTISLSLLSISTSYSAINYTCPAKTTAGVKEIALFDGNPRDNARLAPFSDAEPQVWSFPKAKSEPLYLGCYYGKREEATYKELPSTLTKCVRRFQNSTPYFECT